MAQLAGKDLLVSVFGLKLRKTFTFYYPVVNYPKLPVYCVEREINYQYWLSLARMDFVYINVGGEY